MQEFGRCQTAGGACLLKRIDDNARRATRWLALIGFAGLFVLAMMTTLDVLMRWLFSAPIHGVNDVSAVVMAVVIASCIPANLAERRNISVEIFGAAVGPRTTRWLNAFASLVVFVVIALMAWKFIPFSRSAFDTGRQTWVLAWPVWPWWAFATALLIFAAFIQLSNLIRDVCALFTDATTPPAVEHDRREEIAPSAPEESGI